MNNKLTQGLITKIATTVLLFSLLFCAHLPAQNNSNPFELTPRLSPDQRQKDTAKLTEVPGNPFDIGIYPGEEESTEEIRNPVTTTAPPDKKIDYYSGFLFGVMLFCLVLLTLMIMAFRPAIDKVYRSLTNDNMLSQVYREFKTGGPAAYFLLYGMFMINAGVFVFLLLQKYGISLPYGYFNTLLICIWAIAGGFLFKHLLLGLVGYIFPVQKEISLYNFTIIIFSIIIGLLLVPANLILAYAPDFVAQGTLWLSLIIIGILYLFRYGHGLFIANKFLVFHKFHFLLYICTVEIAPVLVVIKLINSELPL